ncbi:nitrogen fixation protein NifX [Niallia nealsonii]|uniref:Nitrogen fixation protein NifX n=1 Tax=Niallia nealsonii TaxID=115979 RepID=A0A2N0YYK7_9BACI|nr:nitrogen fixation protein NifX [Niallia nealsonii]
MKVAFSTADGESINTHFGYSAAFDIYEITKGRYEKLATRVIINEENNNESDRIEERLNLIIDCTLLFITQIGPTAAARVTRNKIMPVKVKEDTLIKEQLDKLLKMLQTNPPLWLVKAMNDRTKEEEHLQS